MRITLDTVTSFPATSLAYIRTACDPSVKCMGGVTQLAPASALASRDESPEITSVAVADRSTSEIYQPFLPSTGGRMTSRSGGVPSRCQVDDPLAVRPLVDVTV